ncbi:MAG: aminoacyl-tRNA hydrolase, partial [Gammaproteobacteria bacterium]
QCNVSGKDRRVFKPSTYMNHSGQAVAALAGFYRIPLPEILVVHDDIDLPVGTVKLKRGGGHGGHNGLRDLISHLGGNDFYRLRIGVEHPGHRDEVTDYVLQRPSKQDREQINEAIDDALSVLPLVLEGDVEGAMNKLHSNDNSK